MKYAYLLLALFLLGTVVCTAAIPAEDDPETAFNEADSSSEYALPVSQCTRLIRPFVRAVVMSKRLHCSPPRINKGAQPLFSLAPKQRIPQPLPTLLCAFLI